MLPTSRITGSQCFYSCSTSLVGGNGAAWVSRPQTTSMDPFESDRIHAIPFSSHLDADQRDLGLKPSGLLMVATMNYHSMPSGTRCSMTVCVGKAVRLAFGAFALRNLTCRRHEHEVTAAPR